ncbi:hypothetical protein [Paremcibacter congregatus]|uniref:hypothetical protein n=1 Tax=Paremcibacter congregatus TaxID=2043170 RepID=UPI0010563E27|nr:hypothetical protein [Paremcibacter congregatus]QDE26305.1 hypothetical protein FIV45_02915 [Paremcibacter congregatus]
MGATEVFVSEAFNCNIAVLGNGTFSVSSNSNKPGVRLCLSAAPNIAELEVGLLMLAAMDNRPACQKGINVPPKKNGSADVRVQKIARFVGN